MEKLTKGILVQHLGIQFTGILYLIKGRVIITFKYIYVS